MKIKKCRVCGKYTLKKEHCQKETKEAGYKFLKMDKKIIISKTTSSILLMLVK